jgi:hypothetical protein
MSRAESLARAGDHSQAAAEVAALAGDRKASGDSLVHAARILAIAASGSRQVPPEINEVFAARACGYLARAERSGSFKDKAKAARAVRDPDLSTLHRRPDFPTLILDQSFPNDAFARP